MAVISEEHIEQIVIQEFIDLAYSYINRADISLDGVTQERAYDEVNLKNLVSNLQSKRSSKLTFQFSTILL
jgi:type I restriction enzyme R subunit